MPTRKILSAMPVLMMCFSFMGPALALEPAVISGQVTESGTGTPISGATVAISESKLRVWTQQTDALGHFEIEIPMNALQSSRTVVIEAAGPDHLPSRRNGSPAISACFFGCQGDGRITIHSGDELTDQDLSLTPGGGRFSGAVVSQSSGIPLADIEVLPLTVADNGFITAMSQHFAGISGPDGSYTAPLALLPGQYHVLAEAPTQNFVTTALGGVVCQYGRCPFAATDTLDIEDNDLLGGVNFSLRSGASVSGTLLPDDVTRVVSIYDGAGVLVTQMTLPAGTSDWSRDRLGGGSYYLELGSLAGSNLVRRLHNGLDCAFSGCERARGPALEVPVAGSVSDIEVTLAVGGTLSGTIIDANSGLAPAASDDGIVGSFNLVDDQGAVAGGGSIRADGDAVTFVSSGGIAPGSYFVRTFDFWGSRGIGNPAPLGSAREHLPGVADAAFPDLSCVGIACDLDQAGTVQINAGENSEIQIAVRQGSNISGSVLDHASGEGIGPTLVELVDAQNRRLATAITDPDGGFVFGAFPAGTYYLRTAMSSALSPFFNPVQNPYFDRVWGADESCSEQLCDPTAGTALVLDGTNDAGPLEIRVEGGPVISGRIFDQASGQLITRGRVEIRTEDDRLVGLYSISIINGRFQSTALPPGTYTLIPRISPAFIPLPIPASSPEQATTSLAGASRQATTGFQVALGQSSVQTELRVVDAAADRVFRSGFILTPYGQ